MSKNRDFLIWVGGTTADSLGNSIVTLALPLAALSVSGSPVVAGSLTTAYSVVFAGFVLFGGAVVDRIDRRVGMLVKSGFGCVLWTVIALLVGGQDASIPAFVILLLAAGLNRALFGSADNAALRSIVRGPELPRAQGVVQAREAAIELAGAPIGGALVGLALGTPFFVAAGCSAVLGVAAVLIRTDLHPAPANRSSADRSRFLGLGSVAADIVEGLAFVWQDRLIRHSIVLVAALNVAVALTLQVATLSFASTGVAAVQIAILYSAAAAAMLIGAVTSAQLVSRVRNGPLVLVSFAVIALALMLIAAVPQFIAVLCALVLIGFAVPTASAVLQGYVAWATPTGRQGRIISVMTLASLGLSALAPLFAGLIVDARMAWLGYALAALLAIGCVLGALASRQLRDLGKPEEWAASSDDGAAEGQAGMLG